MVQRRIAKVFTATLGALAATLLLKVGAVHAHDYTNVDRCGQPLDIPGEYVLTTDLNCSGTLANGINITASNVIFHLGNHTIESTDCDETRAISGISVQGGLTNVQIDGGTVSGFRDGVLLASSNSRVAGMTIKNSCVLVSWRKE